VPSGEHVCQVGRGHVGAEREQADEQARRPECNRHRDTPVRAPPEQPESERGRKHFHEGSNRERTSRETVTTAVECVQSERDCERESDVHLPVDQRDTAVPGDECESEQENGIQSRERAATASERTPEQGGNPCGGTDV